MTKLLLCVLSLCVLSTGCLKNEKGCAPQNDIVAPQSEQQVVVDYLAANNIDASKHKSGMYYQILQPGTSGSPNNCSSIAIDYVGRLTNGNLFDQGNNAVFTLGGLIEGWKMGLPLIQKGGRIKLYIPPSLAYGSTDVKDRNGTVVIPGNSMLIFEIKLSDFQ